RYGSRVDVHFNTQVEQQVDIAPLLLLTFVENAFKHGVSQEIKKARIDIDLTTTQEAIFFKIKNTIPPAANILSTQNGIGLDNVKKQLALLYPNAHQLEISATEDSYEIELRIKV
ncbi:MAG: histidine kinase, partial [Saprospiraceae bacterium]